MSESICNIFTILKRELKSYFESPVAYVFLCAFLVLTGVFTFHSGFGAYYELEKADLTFPFFFWHPWLYLLLAPAVAMRLWAEERRSGTIELLLTLPVTLNQAIIGKFLAAWLFMGLALALTFPVVVTTVYLGNPDEGAVIGGYLGSFLVSGAYLAVGMLASSLSRSQVVSFVLSFCACLVLALAGHAPVTGMLAERVPIWLVEWVSRVSVLSHYNYMQRGVIDLRDIVYFLSVMVVMLSATHLVLRNRRSI
jgi:ABC-2 type transport system permease protein